MFKFCAVFIISLNVSFFNDYSFGVGGVMLVPLSCPICISSVSIYTQIFSFTLLWLQKVVQTFMMENTNFLFKLKNGEKPALQLIFE